MRPKLIKIHYKNDFIYHLIFDDGHEADIDFKDFLWGEAFKELKKQDFFKKAFIDQTTGTISWPNGPDIAPETLYKKATSHDDSHVASAR